MESNTRIKTDEFVDWCERQAEQSRSMTSRIIHDGDDKVRFRLREEDTPEDIVLIKGKEVDTIRFEKGDTTKQYHAHKRDITMHDKTLIVRHSSGAEMCRAGTGTKNKRGPFPA